MADVAEETKAVEIPFDLYGDLEDAYDDAERNGDEEIVQTLDIFGLWKDRPIAGTRFMHKIWRALNGDVVAQADVGHAFYWDDNVPDEKRERFKWLDRPALAIYWYGLAAEAGYGLAQWDLARLYCPHFDPHSEFENGRFARHWLEQAAAHKLKGAMCDLVHCLKCGACSCGRDIPRAEALEAAMDGEG